jgi:hypothetical protein
LNNDRVTVVAFPLDKSEIVREMLATLADVSTAGQRHLMNKIVGIIEGELRKTIRNQSAANRRVLTEQLVRLRRESNRVLPDTSNFVQGAGNVLALLDAIA